jgi:hypothetical protein
MSIGLGLATRPPPKLLCGPVGTPIGFSIAHPATDKAANNAAAIIVNPAFITLNSPTYGNAHH